jgi:hypothetical protein
MQLVDGPRTSCEFLHLYDKPVKHSPKQRRNGAGKTTKLSPADDDFESEQRPQRETYSTIDLARDVMAAGNITVAYVAKGFRSLPPLFNRPGRDWPAGPHGRLQVITPTRPHLSDLVYRNRKEIRRTGSPIENAMLHCVLAYFCFLDRTRARLADGIAKQLPPTHSGLADVLFYAYKPTVRGLDGLFRGERQQALPFSDTTTFGFVLRDHLWLDGPIGTMIWGPDAVATLLFSHILRWHRPPLLDGIGLSIVAFDGTVPANCDSFDFLDQRPGVVVLDHATTAVCPCATREEASRPAPLFGEDYFTGLKPDALRAEVRTLARRDDPYARATVERVRRVIAHTPAARAFG